MVLYFVAISVNTIDINLEAKKPKFSFDKKKILYLALMDVVVFAVVFGGLQSFLAYSNQTNTLASNDLLDVTVNANYSDTQPTSTIIPTSSPDISRNINPFNGLALTDKQLERIKNRPLFVMIDNSTPARKNHYNINRSDMVYEAVTEGGWTRFMALYYSDQSDFKVMPVRSVRMHFLKNLMEYNDPLLYHVGGAYTPEEPRINVVQKLFDDKVKTIYYYKHDHTPTLNEIYDPACATDASIPAYSCKFQKTSTLWQKATDIGFQKEPWEAETKYEWKWKFSDAPNPSVTSAKNIKYMFTANKEFEADWTYDESEKVYMRKTAGIPHLDKETKEQLFAQTIIVQKVKHKLNVDDKLRAIVTTEGEGEAMIFMGGLQYNVTWKKDCDTCRTRYFKESGKEFVFNPGRIWVSITRPEEKVIIKE